MQVGLCQRHDANANANANANPWPLSANSICQASHSNIEPLQPILDAICPTYAGEHYVRLQLDVCVVASQGPRPE